MQKKIIFPICAAIIKLTLHIVLFANLHATKMLMRHATLDSNFSVSLVKQLFTINIYGTVWGKQRKKNYGLETKDMFLFNNI